MANGEDKRKAHVKRVHKMEANPDFPNSEKRMFMDVWVDMLRIDTLPVKFQTEAGPDMKGLEGQIVKYVFRWNDDIKNPEPDIVVDENKAEIKQYENTNPKRKTKKLLIKDPSVEAPPKGKPQQNVDDNSVSLWIVQQVTVDEPRGKPFAHAGQKVKYRFNNRMPDDPDGPASEIRKTTPVKVVNNDLNGLRMMDDEEPLIISWSDYLTALNAGKIDEDDKLFLTVEVVDKFTARFQAEAKTGQEGQLRKVILKNKKVEELFKEGDRNAVDAYGNPAVIRLDPLQVIVNVGSNIIAVEFAPGKK